MLFISVLWTGCSRRVREMETNMNDKTHTKANACVVCNADIPWLLAELERLKETNKALENDNYNAEMNLSRLTEEVTRLKSERDAAPVGEWVEAKSGSMSLYPYGQKMCSLCKTIMPSAWKVMPPYCYGCGAKMEDKA